METNRPQPHYTIRTTEGVYTVTKLDVGSYVVNYNPLHRQLQYSDLMFFDCHERAVAFIAETVSAAKYFIRRHAVASVAIN